MVVPDNMVVLHKGEIRTEKSYAVPLQPCNPFLVMEYVSKSNERKDYKDSFNKYEQELKVPYYLLFYPDNEELTLFRPLAKRYVTVKPNAAGLCPIPELEIEVGLVDNWLRFWFWGKMLPHASELKQAYQEQERQIDEQQRRLQETERRLAQERDANAQLQARLAEALEAIQAMQSPKS